MVDVDALTTEVHRQCDDGTWEVRRYMAANVLHLASIERRRPGALVFSHFERAA